MKNGKIGVTTENIFPVIKKFLYSDHEIFLRELVSNAVDATQKLKTLSAKNEFKGELGDITINISVDTDKKTLTVTDKGIGNGVSMIIMIGIIARLPSAIIEEFEKQGLQKQYYHWDSKKGI